MHCIIFSLYNPLQFIYPFPLHFGQMHLTWGKLVLGWYSEADIKGQDKCVFICQSEIIVLFDVLFYTLVSVTHISRETFSFTLLHIFQHSQEPN